MTRDAVVHHEVDHLLGEIVDNRQALEAPAVFQRVHHKIDGPDFTGSPAAQAKAAARSPHRGVCADDALVDYPRNTAVSCPCVPNTVL